MASCNTCAETVKTYEKFIICSKCDKDYHQECVNISAKDFVKLKQNGNSKWKCPNCKPRKNRGKLSAEGDENRTDVDELSNVRQQNRTKEAKGTVVANYNGDDKKTSDIQVEIQNTLLFELRNIIRSGFNDIKTQVDELKMFRASNDLDILKPHIVESKTKLKGA
ncbi:hypothetical protein PYW08_010518 [Mythimna loreyi]|uniref:Uncharacterized protein n=1 Tax=Mythimna loreyi TaxID=667449 RepID=A0ACC2Q506_9NEOP|nr:hypothetical protein PYW08_010518 [Mythimna loreyi]